MLYTLGIPKVGCPLCGKQLSSEVTLQKHLSSVHEKIRRHSCQHCAYKASTPANLQQHIDSFHLGIKHECDICQAHYMAFFLGVAEPKHREQNTVE
jgi:RNase P subunit RPR2